MINIRILIKEFFKCGGISDYTIVEERKKIEFQACLAQNIKVLAQGIKISKDLKKLSNLFSIYGQEVYSKENPTQIKNLWLLQCIFQNQTQETGT